MSDYEREFESIVRDLSFDDVPNVEHRESLLEKLLYTMGKEGGEPSRRESRARVVIREGRRLMKRKFVKYPLAAASLIAFMTLIAWFAMSALAPKTLYAQVIQSLDKARSIHAVGKGLEDGKWVKQTEVWYEKGKGVAEYGYSPRTYYRVDNGKYQWLKQGDGPIVRSASSDPLGVVRKIFDTYAKLLRDKDRVMTDPQEKDTIDGASCRVYVRYSRPNIAESKHRFLIWIDEDNRARKLEKQRLRDNQHWETYRTTKVEYNVDVDPEHFTPRIAPNEPVVVSEKLLDEFFGLNRTVVQKEIFGHIFAVHQMRRCEGGLIFLLCSSRPTPATIDEFGPIVSRGRKGRGSVTHAYLDLDTSWERVNGKERYHVIHGLGRMYNDGLCARWYVIDPIGDWGENTVTLSVIASSSWKLREKYKREGLPLVKRKIPLATLPIPKDPPWSIKDVLHKTYQDAQSLQTVAFQVYVPNGIVIDNPDGSFSYSGGPPRRISQDEYVTGMQRFIERKTEKYRQAYRQANSPRKAERGKKPSRKNNR